jgi:putative transposase
LWRPISSSCHGHIPPALVLVILAHDRRRIVHVAVTEHPTAAWTAQQLRNAFPENDAPRYLLHDRDSVFAEIATTIAAMNTQAVSVRTAPRSPWQKDYASYCTSLV